MPPSSSLSALPVPPAPTSSGVELNVFEKPFYEMYYLFILEIINNMNKPSLKQLVNNFV